MSRPKLRSAPPRIATTRHRVATAQTPSELRVTGRALQNRRFRLWTRDSKCARCGVFVMYPDGFELDHRVPLYLGGADVDENCQILCVTVGLDGRKGGCHAIKTAEDMGRDGGKG